jgi:hypothetical protein
VKRVLPVLRLRCPRCLRGSVFRSLFRMRRECPVCALRFEREPGYFVGAMYASYILAVLLTAPVWLSLLLTGQSFGLIMAATFVAVMILVPILFHYSRVLWLHFDYIFNPKTFETDPRY